MTDSLSRVLEPFAFCCAGRRTISRTTLTTSRLAAIESGLRTGDMLLFNEDARLPDTSTFSARRCAAFLSRILSVLPCMAYPSANWPAPNSDDDQYSTPRPAHRPVQHSQWLDWQHSALIICLPTQNAQGVPHETDREPCVFFNNIATGVFDLLPLREFLQRVAGSNRTTFAVRHLIVHDEAQLPNHIIAHRKVVSQRRAYIHQHMYDFQHSIHQESLAPQVASLQQVTARIVNGDRLPPDFQSANDAATKRDLLLLLRGSMSFTTLYTLYTAQVLRVEPRMVDAAALVQERNATLLQNQMAADYHFTAERLFIFDSQQ